MTVTVADNTFDHVHHAPQVWRRLSEASRRRCDQSYAPLTSWSPDDWIRAMCGEVGELLNAIKKADDPDHAGRPATLEPLTAVADEAADVLIYLDLLMQRMGSTVARVTTPPDFGPVASWADFTIRELCFALFQASANLWRHIRDGADAHTVEYPCAEVFHATAFILNRCERSAWPCVVDKFNRRSRDVGSIEFLEV